MSPLEDVSCLATPNLEGWRMSFPSRALIILVAWLSVAGAVACGGAEQSGAKPAEPAVAATPQPTAVDAKARMDEHFTKVRTIEEAVIRGDIEDVRESAMWVADNQGLAGLPANLQPKIDELKGSARAAAAARDIWSAAQATASMVATCGACHKTANATPTMAPPAMPPAQPAGMPGHMLAHQHAVDLMYQGLVGPSDDAWKKGAEELKKAPLTLKELPKDPLLTKEIAAIEGAVHAMADRAETAVETRARVALYGELIAACANCHSLHGDIWGPGLPKK
jgi:hypothetical protein